jgi:hypothetical protein
MHTPSTPWLDRYERWRKLAEVGFWVALTLTNAVANSVTVSVDVERVGLEVPRWAPAVWEFSSGLSWLVLVWPIVWFSRRVPISVARWPTRLALHALAGVLVSIAHVLIMVALRELAYAAHGLDYRFGPWLDGLGYELLKDLRSYAQVVLIVEGYRFVLRRLRGEAVLLGAPDAGEPVESIARPERFVVRKLGRDFLLAANDIEWLQASGNYVNLRVRGHDYPLRSTMAAIEERLDPERFVRIHRSYLVNLAHVASIEPLDSGDARVHLKDLTVLPVSRRYRDALRARVTGD